MTTDCSSRQLEFQGLTRRKVVASFDGGTLSSDGGVLLLAEVDRRRGLLDRFAACFSDHRNPGLIEHTVTELIRQRVFALALAYRGKPLAGAGVVSLPSRRRAEETVQRLQ